MSALVFLIPAALGLGLIGLCAFLWALNRNQFDDLDGAAARILHDEDPLPPRAGDERPRRRAPPGP